MKMFSFTKNEALEAESQTTRTSGTLSVFRGSKGHNVIFFFPLLVLEDGSLAIALLSHLFDLALTPFTPRSQISAHFNLAQWWEWFGSSANV